MTAPNKWQIRRIAGSLGAEVDEVNLKAADRDLAQKIIDLLLEHKVLIFRDQFLTPAELLAFSKHFGTPTVYPFVKGIEGCPEIMQLGNANALSGIWHSDTTYMERPSMITMLQAQEMPPYGGDTLFANQVAAYEALSPGLKETLANLTCVNTSTKTATAKTRTDRVREAGHQTNDRTAHHPAVIEHPETGAQALYVNVAHTERFENWTVEESKPLLKYLFQHQVQPEFTCRVRWDEGTVVIWDNFQVQHNPVNDYDGFRRSMLRITLTRN